MAEIFWSAQNSDPKRKFRFQLLVDRIPVWVVKTVSKPSVTVNPVVHQYLNHEFRYPGRVTWDSPINVTLVDPLDPDLARTTLNMIRNAGYRYPLDPNQSKTTMTKADATKALGRVSIQQIDGDGNPVEEWVLRNAFVSKITYGDLDYSSDDMSEITLEITYDWAELQLSHAPANGYSVEADKQQADADGVVRSSILT
tara:strand:+ start:595 stop:1188 length:594 start_codon:yes stop_codon:yes gene_type:complete